MKTLLIDNYDSFTYNLFQLLAEANGEEPVVVRNDGAGWEELQGWDFDNIVISPGPGRPDHEKDFGVCADAIAQTEVPLLGVCLGHQGLGFASGAEVVHAPEVMHGRLSAVLHEDSPLFAGIPREFQAVRYHSLCVSQPLPEELEPIAWTSDGVLMAVAHRERPLWGVQFHPESICTDYGRRLLANFRDLTRKAARERKAPPGAARTPTAPAARDWRPEQRSRLSLKVKRLDRLYDPERAFVHLYGDSPHAFWLDSSKVDERSRFSFMGASGGPLGAVVTYDVASKEVKVERPDATEVHAETIFDYLSREMRRLRYLSDELPFDLNCGFVGYFGYELKADCEGDLAHEASTPDAAFLFADRLIAFDHLEQATYVLCLTDPMSEAEGDRWVRETSVRLASLPPVTTPDWEESGSGGAPVEFHLSRSHEQYLEDIAACKQYLVDGETYEVCLTNKVRTEATPDPLPLYRTLRRVNPAPFSAFLRFGETSVLSSSPERFLSIGRDRWVEAKPIKGTSPRGATPAEDVHISEELRTSEKNRAENLMITDLLRNDLGVVCEIGTVHVPHLMQVETYETVHQLVSTVRGLLREDLEPPDCVRACFPGGSMTGAPKKRTMEIIDELEREPRGVYSGAIGYLGLSGGCDLNIVIRTIVMDGESTTIGMGGAIVMQSDAEEEYEETLLKGRALMQAIDPGADPQRAFDGRAAPVAARVEDSDPEAGAPLVTAMLDAAADAASERPALVHGDERIGWGEVRERADRLASGLGSLGLGPGDPVALVLPNVPAFAVAFFAVARLGGIVVPLNPQFKRAELEFHFREARVRAVVTDEQTLESCRSIVSGWDEGVRLVCAGAGGGDAVSLEGLIADHASASVDGSSPDAEAVFQYSSGSTGRPKRVPRTHRHLRLEADSIVATEGLTPEDVMFCTIPLFHTYGMGCCLLAAVRAGATLVLPDDIQPFVLKRENVLRGLERERATVFPAVPFTFRMLAEAPGSADLSSLRLCTSAANALPRSTFDAFQRKFGIPIRQLYGCTEAGAVTVNLDEDPASTAASVGRPYEGVAIEVVDAAGETLGPGRNGEIVIRSPAMTSGYAGTPADLNRRAFAGGGFHSGDRGRIDEYGRLFITGRQKLLIDVKGDKVDPIEVEDVLAVHPKVGEVVVVGVASDVDGEELIKAAVVPKRPCQERELIRYCRERLADYKVPQKIEFLEEIPRSSAGKVLRKYLVE
jgi:para-aminobenzoate synthetase